MHLGDFWTGQVVDFKFNTQAADGASCTFTGDGTYLKIYKGNSATPRASASGVVLTKDFDTTTGVHHVRIDLSDNADSGFYAANQEYQVLIRNIIVDGKTVSVSLATFSIVRPQNWFGESWDASAGVETGVSLRQAIRLMLSALVGKCSGLGTTTNTFRNVNDTKNVIVATTDTDGNRSAVTLDKDQ